MTFKIIIYSLLMVLFFTACKNENDANSSDQEVTENKTDFQPIEELFSSTDFEKPFYLELLQELNICTIDSSKLIDPKTSYCSAANYKFFPLQKDLSEKNGFVLLIKAGTGNFPLRRLLIFQRERGKLVKVNGFVANIIGRIPSESGYDDLLLRFNDKDGNEDMFYNCLFTWEEGQYQYKQVDVIEGANWGGTVKAEFKDSISKEIYQNILNNQMIF
ncbi:MAG: hypothetical protein KJ941_09115 [Bacteroidetes bacterium]|nr:hypothetical protein [Bacteroidota bacterium]